MTAPLAEQVAAALAEHRAVSRQVDDQLRLGCLCGGDVRPTPPYRVATRADHARHQADAVLVEVVAWLGEFDTRLNVARVLESQLDEARAHGFGANPEFVGSAVLGALRSALRPPNAPNTPAPVPQDPRGAQGGSEGRGAGGGL